MDKEQAQQIIKAAFAIGGWSIPDSFDARSVAERLLPLDYVTAQDWIDTTIENGGDTRDFGRMIEQLRRLSGKTTVSEWAEKRESFFTRLGENDQMVRDIFGAAFDELRYLLPGYCDGCLEWSIKRQEMYWGAHPHLCFKCQHSVIVQLDSGRVEWPEPHFPDSL